MRASGFSPFFTCGRLADMKTAWMRLQVRGVDVEISANSRLSYARKQRDFLRFLQNVVASFDVVRMPTKHGLQVPYS